MSWTLLNTSVNQTLSRTMLTGFTTWLVALIWYAVGGQGIRGFSFVLTAGEQGVARVCSRSEQRPIVRGANSDYPVRGANSDVLVRGANNDH